jgi:hypothetical protein
MLTPRTATPRLQTGASSTPAAGSAGPGLEAIARCESGGDPRAVSPDGTYRGKYQFDSQTWRSVGGAGDPAEAPEAEQDKRAAMLQAQRGNQPGLSAGPSTLANALPLRPRSGARGGPIGAALFVAGAPAHGLSWVNPRSRTASG